MNNTGVSNAIDFPTTRVPRTTLGDLAGRFALVESRENPDWDVPLTSLSATPAGNVEIAGHGDFGLTDWSRNQLGQALGIQWHRFFAGAGLDEQAEDLNRRLRRAHGVVRLRTTSDKLDGAAGDGTLRAVVSPGFTAVKDTLITQLLSDSLRTSDPQARVIRSEVTPLSTSFVIKIGEAYRIGGPGKVGEVWGALVCRNSGVGYAKLVISLSLVRLACLNGMTCPVPLPAIVRARHAWLDEGQIREAVRLGLEGVGDRLAKGTQVLADSAHHAVDDIDGEVRRVLKSARLPLRLARPVLSAYGREPHASRFGVSQALTLAAQAETPEVRLVLEDLAGRYLATGG